jgi:hypothetical protein
MIDVTSPEDPADGLAAVVALRRLAEQLEAAEVERAMRAGWSWPEVAEALGVTRQAVHKKHAKRLIVADTSLPGRDDGALDVERLAATLDDETPTILAMHHPPLDIGLPWLDEIGHTPANRAALAELLTGAPNVKRVVAGHVHRVVHSTLAGCGVVTCASTNIQSELDFVATDMVLTTEPPSLLVHALLDSGELVTHVQPI